MHQADTFSTGATASGCREARLLILMVDITEHRVLKQMVEQTTEIVPHVDQDLDALCNRSRVIKQITTSRLVQPQDGAQFSRLVVLSYTFVHVG
jgi:hypothetical protein